MRFLALGARDVGDKAKAADQGLRLGLGERHGVDRHTAVRAASTNGAGSACTPGARPSTGDPPACAAGLHRARAPSAAARSGGRARRSAAGSAMCEACPAGRQAQARAAPRSIVDVTLFGSSRTFIAARAPVARRRTEPPAEGVGEVGGGREPAAPGHLADRERRLGEERAGPVEPAVPQHVARRRTERPADAPREVAPLGVDGPRPGLDVEARVAEAGVERLGGPLAEAVHRPG